MLWMLSFGVADDVFRCCECAVPTVGALATPLILRLCSAYVIRILLQYFKSHNKSTIKICARYFSLTTNLLYKSGEENIQFNPLDLFLEQL
jgi:hypothetical protein